jgi:hypothetical protein
MSHDGNRQQSFALLPLKPNGQNKTWVHMAKFHPFQQTLGMICLREFADRAFKTQHLSQINKGSGA